MAWDWHGICELASAVQGRHVGDLPVFGVFLLPRGVSGSLLSEAIPVLAHAVDRLLVPGSLSVSSEDPKNSEE
jgi:hypothetical protein